MRSDGDGAALRLAAGAAVVTHVLAFAGLVVWSAGEPASAGAPSPAVLASAAWRAGWLLWIPAGLALLWLTQLVADGLGRPPAARVAVGLTILAVGVDGVFDVSHAMLQPALAAIGAAADVQGAVARWLDVGSVTVANGLFSLATVALVVALRGAGRLKHARLGTLLAAAGLWMALEGVLAAPARLAVATVATFVLCIAFFIHLATLGRRDSVAAAADPVRTQPAR